MMRKYFIVLLSILVLVAALGYINQNRWKNERTFSFDNGKQVIDSLDHLFKALSSMESGNPDSVESIISLNENIREVVEQITAPKILEEAYDFYQSKNHDFVLILTSDKKMGVFSWENGINGAKHRIKNIALYAKGSRLTPTSLYGDPVIYDKVYNIKNNRNIPIYILSGWRKSVENLNYYRLHAYSIKKNGVEEVNIFPNYGTFIESRQSESLRQFPLNFNVENHGMKIMIPTVMDSTLAYDTLTFNGKKYIFNSKG